MKNKLLRKAISFLFSFMNSTNRIDIYNKYETVADLAYQLSYTTSNTRIQDISMRKRYSCPVCEKLIIDTCIECDTLVDNI